VIRPWGLSFGTTSLILLSSGSAASSAAWSGLRRRSIWTQADLCDHDRRLLSRQPCAGVHAGGNGSGSSFFAHCSALARGFLRPGDAVQETVPRSCGRAVGIVSATTRGLLLALSVELSCARHRLARMSSSAHCRRFYALLVWYVLPESPRWAALSRKTELARESLDGLGRRKRRRSRKAHDRHRGRRIIASWRAIRAVS